MTRLIIAGPRDPGIEAAEAVQRWNSGDLSVEFRETPSGLEAVEGLAEGRWSMVHADADAIFTAPAEIGAFIVLVPALGWDRRAVGRADLPAWEGLRGCRLAVEGRDRADGLLLEAFLASHELNAEAVEWVAVASAPNRLDHLLAGAVDLAVLPGPLVARALAAGYRDFGPAAAAVPEYPGWVLATTHAFNAQHPELVVTYARILWQAWATVSAPTGGAVLVHPSLAATRAALESALALRARLRSDPGRLGRFFDPAVMNAMF
ncbi:MAG: ABC transporter substrate-binding protein [Firmicutes bacterium]|nr:ABC transporter substrate-binding protein [Alicyclobacillaceae bacterium]MCL6496044.1 ABC transporter substrate-binding protein [Bacillota bacterium]